MNVVLYLLIFYVYKVAHVLWLVKPLKPLVLDLLNDALLGLGLGQWCVTYISTFVDVPFPLFFVLKNFCNGSVYFEDYYILHSK